MSLLPQSDHVKNWVKIEPIQRVGRISEKVGRIRTKVGRIQKEVGHIPSPFGHNTQKKRVQGPCPHPLLDFIRGPVLA